MSTSSYQPRYIDIGVNLADPIFRGRYPNGKRYHPDDLAEVIQRARDVGCTKMMVTGSSFKSSRDALALVKEFPNTVYATAGIHPCSSAIFASSHLPHHEASDKEHMSACNIDPSSTAVNGNPDSAANDNSSTVVNGNPDSAVNGNSSTVVNGNTDSAVDLIKSASIINDLKLLITCAGPGLVALGEFGLDYDRLHFCPADVQRHSFAAQLELAASLTPQLPLFLHSRACRADFLAAMKHAFGDRLERLERGAVVHSFTGSVEEMRELMDLGLYIGVNGCSFKTAENCAVVKEIRLDRMMLETDGPWCEIRPSHEGWKYLLPSPPPAEAEKDADGQDGVPDPDTTMQQSKKKTKKQKQQQSAAGEVPSRFRSVKKEKWVGDNMVKGRNEPCMIERVATIVAAIKGVSVEEVCEATWANTVKVFGLDE